MGRRRSIPGDPPRVRLLRESFERPSIAADDLRQLRRTFVAAIEIIDRAINR